MITFQGKSEVARVLEALMPGQLEGTGIEPLSPATSLLPWKVIMVDQGVPQWTSCEDPSAEVEAFSGRTVAAERRG